jgi:hypothetical protein
LRTDHSTFIGGFPFRHVPHPEPEILVRVLEREGVARAWVGSLPAAFHRDPSHANDELVRRLEPFRAVLHAVPTIRPGWPGWEHRVRDAAQAGAPAIRCYPTHGGLPPGDARLTALAAAAAEHHLIVVLTSRFEDARQRHLLDRADDLSAAHVRELARAGTGARILLTAAGRETIEEVHWGLTPDERTRLHYDISWIWGPPTNEFAHLVRTVGAARFVYGSMWPLRLSQFPRANLALLEAMMGSVALSDASTW